ncbi:MAG TPA: hypothetical protein VF283_10875 [Bryobacteraceae bacterium]
MDWSHIAEIASDALTLGLIFRLLSLRLQSAYRVFCVLLLFEVVTSGIALWLHFAHLVQVNYRIVWLSFAPVGWILYLATVYALLNALLKKFPGILRFSRTVLHISFLVAALIGVLTARPEFVAYERTVPGSTGSLNHLVAAGFVGERIFSMVAALAILVTLAFILWFPVQLPRNLTVFSLGLVVYFGARASLILAYSFFSSVNLNAVNMSVMFILTACLLYFLIFINKAGEEAPVRIGHSWNAAEQQRLIGQLEAMNAALLRSARRS